MRVKTYLSERGNDYTAIMVCEHCGHQQVDPVELSHQMIPYQNTQIRAANEPTEDRE